MQIKTKSDYWVIPLISSQTNERVFKDEINKITSLFQHSQVMKSFECNSYLYSFIQIPNLEDTVARDNLFKLNLESSFGLLKNSILQTKKKLIAFDMDSTLVQMETLNEFAGTQNLKDTVSLITEEAMLGKIDYNESFIKRIVLLKGIEESRINELANRVPITNGVDLLIKHINEAKIKKAVISGGLIQFGEVLNKKYHFDYLYLNEIDIENNKINGTVSKEIVNTEKKAEILKKIISKENITKDETVSVGDGANDVLMFQESGLSVAYNGKPKAKAAADICINGLGLDSILPIIGLGI